MFSPLLGLWTAGRPMVVDAEEQPAPCPAPSVPLPTYTQLDLFGGIADGAAVRAHLAELAKPEPSLDELIATGVVVVGEAVAEPVVKRANHAVDHKGENSVQVLL